MNSSECLLTLQRCGRDVAEMMSACRASCSGATSGGVGSGIPREEVLGAVEGREG